MEYLEDILEASQRVVDYCAGMTYDLFLADSKTQDAVARNIEILGEAVKGVSESLRQENPQIPWKNIAGMRDRLIHGYFGVNWDVVWGVVDRDLPLLLEEVKILVAKNR